ncbi:hypothetical protein [Vibrio splendidus]|uniref:hypothetical protein n=1 Tax=Vibrio splendidus TaxID=29497 RepID=UPI000E0922A7|nr:hypothetical protein [Vibrio splendidus]
MSNPISLIEELKKGGYDSCLMTSYSINFVFYEEYLLRKMQIAGVTNHLLFVDNRMLKAAIQHFPPKFAGYAYGIAPMKCNQAFHPKVYMLLGKNKGLLIVGSHNMTLSGFGSNLEVTNVIRFDEKSNDKDLSIFKDAFHAFEVWLNDYGQSSSQIVREMLGKAKTLAPWIKKTPKLPSSKSFLFSSFSNKECLWRSLQTQLPQTVDKTYGVSAFFDRSGQFVSSLSEFSVAKPIIAIQPKSVCLNTTILQSGTVKFVDIKSIQPDGLSNFTTYAHAKALVFLAKQETFFISGSANFSSNAWLKTGSNTNAEAMLLLRNGEAKEAIISTNFLDMVTSEEVLEVNSEELIEGSTDTTHIELLFVELGLDQSLEIELVDSHRGCQPFYKDEFGDYYQIEHTLDNQVIFISEQLLDCGKLIYLLLNEELIATVVTLNVPSLEKLCESSEERQLRQAVSSLSTDYPQFDLLFNCIEKLTPQLRRSVGASEKYTQQTQDDMNDRDSLIVSIDQENYAYTKSGRRTISSDGLNLILDMFLLAIPSNQSDSNSLYREDYLGRNEEELVGTDDEDTVENPSISPEQIEYVHKKLTKILNKLEKVYVSNSDNEANKMSFLLMAFVVIHNLSRHEFIIGSHEIKVQQTKDDANKTKPIVDDKHLQKLREISFFRFFNEKESPIQISNDSENIYNSNEYTQLLALVSWLLFKLGICYGDAPPLSKSVKECEIIHCENAQMLFLMQRLDGDEEAYKITKNLLESDSSSALEWLYRSMSETELLLYEDRFPYKGYQLAKSNLAGFNGFCFVDKQRNNRPSVQLATVGSNLTFSRKSLDIVF